MNDTQGPIGFQTCYTYKQVCRPVSRLISFAFGPLKIEILDTEEKESGVSYSEWRCDISFLI